MTHGLGAELIALARATMAAAQFDCPLVETDAQAEPFSSSVTFKNQHAIVDFVYDGLERHFSCTLSLWRRNVDPPDPCRGTQFVVAQIPVALLDLSVAKPNCYPTDVKTAVPYWTRLLEQHGQDLLSGDFQGLHYRKRDLLRSDRSELGTYGEDPDEQD